MEEPAKAPWSPSAELIQQVDTAMAAWRQGDYVDGNYAVHVGDPTRPLTPISQEAGANGAEAGEVVLTREVLGLVAIEQSCDIVRSCKVQPYIQFAQLVTLEDKESAEARGRRRPRYAHVPGSGLNAFADLEVVTTLEKSVVAAWTRKEGCRTDAEQRQFSEAVRRKGSRYAFPGDVAKALEPLRQELDKHDGKPTELGAAVGELREIRILALPDWSTEKFDVYVYFLLPPSGVALSRSLEDWSVLVKGWLSACKPQGQVLSVEGDVHQLDTVTAEDYLQSDEWDTDTFSP